MSKVDKLVVLLEEIAEARSHLEDHGTGHIHTAINWMQYRVDSLRAELQGESALGALSESS